MKLFFVNEDSLYKIFKTLEKIPRWKDVEISIEPDHPLFDNERWWRQIKDILDKKSINAEFVTNTEKCKKFFEKIWLKVKYNEQNKFIKFIKSLYLFLFNIKKFHLNSLKNENEKRYWIFLVFWFEILFVLWIIYLIYTLVVPNAKITINPSQSSETIIYNFRYYPSQDIEYQNYSRFINVPYYSWNFEYKYDLSMNTSNIKYIQNPSIWEIKIINTTNSDYTFVPNTRFITEDWRLFQTTNYVTLPAAQNWVAWEKIIRVKAMEQDDNWILMWNRWNIERWTKLYIKNLKQSLFLKEIYAIALDDFSGGSLDSEWEISNEDINILTEKLTSYINQQKKNISSQNFSEENSILLTFEDTINYKIKSIEIPSNPWDKSSIISWSIIAEISYFYVKRDDLIYAFSEYINQRPSKKTQLVSIDKNSLVFYEDDASKENNWIFITPTKIEVIQAYDFNKDINWIQEEIKSHIIWWDKEESRVFILSYPEVSSVKIKVKPARYNNIPKLKSRIKLIINK